MEKLIYEYSQAGKEGVSLPQGIESAVSPAELIPAELLRQSELQLPEVSEPEVVRHFTNLSTMNHHVDKDLYPLGSCTMKYNPKVNDRSAALSGLANCH
ncbi:MAG TPA: aminomethyl-transferring glycine dehydrogenase subunit GcvPB, partial [Candidatus Marinimicrobia bacterium]|nr:aminomethyl-transferring glycine dehydrogenase subunit GcvPB [Candidatus Neomarinimicrobiota bacterium]